MSTSAPMNPPGGPPISKKRTSPWIFVLLGCGGIIVLAGVAMIALGVFAVHKAKEAGLDPGLLKSNPALAAAKMIAAANPDIEIVNFDKDAGKITFKEKSSGKTVTVSLDDVKKGKITFETEEGTTTLQATGEGKEGQIRLNTPQGEFVAGGNTGAELPAWVPHYPNGEVKGMMNQSSGKGSVRMIQLTTGDEIANVAAFYADQLKQQGFEVSKLESPGGHIVNGADKANQRTVMVVLESKGGQTTAVITASEGQQ